MLVTTIAGSRGEAGLGEGDAVGLTVFLTVRVGEDLRDPDYILHHLATLCLQSSPCLG